MNVVRVVIILSIQFIVLTTSASFAGTAVPSLSAPPLGEHWFSISLNGERTGFASQNIARAEAGGYEISAVGSVKMLVLGFSREASARERYLVNGDLSLRAFAVDQVLDGSRLRLSGEVTAGGIRLHTESAGVKTEKLLKVRGAVYPPPVLNLYPLMRGVAPGKSVRMQLFDAEAVSVKEVKISVLGRETLEGGVRVVHLQNDLYKFVDNDIWVDPEGNTIRESVRDGLVVTAAEDQVTAKRFILEAAVAKKDLILDFSLVRVDPPLSRPEKLTRLVVELSGISRDIPLLQGRGQKAVRIDGERVLYTMDSPELQTASGEAPGTIGETRRYLGESQRLPVNSPEIVARKNALLTGTEQPRVAVDTLARWVASYVKGTVTDSQSPLETLNSREGNCQSHARLYTTLARAAGIPTRFVSGLVYVTGKGFLYHSWAESLTGDWLAVDPTFAQVPADVTHIKLVEGDSPEEMLPLAGIVGRVKAIVVEQRH